MLRGRLTYARRSRTEPDTLVLRVAMGEEFSRAVRVLGLDRAREARPTGAHVVINTDSAMTEATRAMRKGGRWMLHKPRTAAQVSRLLLRVYRRFCRIERDALMRAGVVRAEDTRALYDRANAAGSAAHFAVMGLARLAGGETPTGTLDVLRLHWHDGIFRLPHSPTSAAKSGNHTSAPEREEAGHAA